MDNYNIKKAGLREYATSPDGKVQYSRRCVEATSKWQLDFDKRGGPEEGERKGEAEEGEKTEEEWILAVVRERQAAGEPDHWSLFVFQEGNESQGQRFQVTGDATSMFYAHSEGPNDVLNSESCKDHYQIATMYAGGIERVRHFANSEPPPSAPTRRDVTEHCQGWTLRVVSRLVDEGVVAKPWIESLRAMMDPI